MEAEVHFLKTIICLFFLLTWRWLGWFCPEWGMCRHHPAKVWHSQICANLERNFRFSLTHYFPGQRWVQFSAFFLCRHLLPLKQNITNKYLHYFLYKDFEKNKKIYLKWLTNNNYRLTLSAVRDHAELRWALSGTTISKAERCPGPLLVKLSAVL